MLWLCENWLAKEYASTHIMKIITLTLTNTSFNHDWKNLINTLHVIDLTTTLFFCSWNRNLTRFFIILWPCSIGRSLLTTKNHLKLYPDRRIGKCQSTEYWKMSSLYCLLYYTYYCCLHNIFFVKSKLYWLHHAFIHLDSFLYFFFQDKISWFWRNRIQCRN